MNKTIDNSKFIAGVLPAIKHQSGLYLFTPNKWYHVRSEHGKSQGETNCICCGATVRFYIWSIAGAGKKCWNCGVILTLGHTMADPLKFKHPDQFENGIGTNEGQAAKEEPLAKGT